MMASIWCISAMRVIWNIPRNHMRLAAWVHSSGSFIGCCHDPVHSGPAPSTIVHTQPHCSVHRSPFGHYSLITSEQCRAMPVIDAHLSLTLVPCLAHNLCNWHCQSPKAVLSYCI